MWELPSPSVLDMRLRYGCVTVRCCGQQRCRMRPPGRGSAEQIAGRADGTGICRCVGERSCVCVRPLVRCHALELRRPGPFESEVALLGNVAVVAALTGDIIGLDARTGRELWRRSTGGASVVQQIASDDRCAYISVGGLICVDATGAILWEIGGDAHNGPLFVTPANPVSGRLFIGSLAGLHAYDLHR